MMDEAMLNRMIGYLAQALINNSRGTGDWSEVDSILCSCSAMSVEAGRVLNTILTLDYNASALESYREWQRELVGSSEVMKAVF